MMIGLLVDIRNIINDQVRVGDDSLAISDSLLPSLLICTPHIGSDYIQDLTVKNSSVISPSPII